MKNNLSLSIIVPIFNEQDTILKILKKLNVIKDKYEIEIILVNDGSIDNSRKIINENKALYSQCIHFEKNRGKGKAVIEGLKLCNMPYVIIQDADLEYDPNDILIFLDELKKFNFDLIMGSRFIGTKRSVLHFWHMLGNKFITFLFNFLNNTTFTDIYCCYCLFKKDLINIEELKCLGWGQQAEILTFAINSKLKLYEIAVNYNGRNYNEGKKIRYHHVFEVIFWMFLTRLKKVFK